jgi:glycosyltransferase involved in cell wall biosynthesis
VTLEAFASKPKREFVVFPASVARRFGAGIARAVAAFRYARREKPDLIIGYHLPWNGAIALLAARMTGCKVFYFAVGGPAELIGGGRYSEHALFSRLDADSEFIENRLLNLAGRFDAILTMGTKSASWFRAETGIDAVHPVAVGIDTSIFSQARQSSAADRRYDVITVGRHSRIKRLDVLLDAVALLVQQGVRVRLALVGDGELRPALETQVAELGISDSVSFVGWVDDVHAYLHDARIFSMTSASEGLPHSLIESMMAGLPAVVSDVGEMSDLVENGQTGFLAPPGDPVTFARRIRELLASPELLSKCGERATSRAARYSVNGRTKIWNELLADL